MNRFFLPKDQQRWIFLMVVVLVSGTGWIILSRVPPATAKPGEQSAPRAGFFAPDFKLDLIDGGQVSLSDLRGKVVVVNLWASWCPPCRIEMPAIEKTFQLYKDHGVAILGVNSTFQDNEQDAAAFVRRYSLTFPILLDRDGSVSKAYALGGLPTTFFIDRSGIIRSVVVGALSEATLQSKIEELSKDAP